MAPMAGCMTLVPEAPGATQVPWVAASHGVVAEARVYSFRPTLQSATNRCVAFLNTKPWGLISPARPNDVKVCALMLGALPTEPADDTMMPVFWLWYSLPSNGDTSMKRP